MPNSIADNLQRLVNAKTAIASAITEKSGTVGVNDGLEEFPAAIAAIPSGGGATRNAVKFYDYDGTLLHSYTKSEFVSLQSMPENPAHEGLTAQGWNWSLPDAKTYVDTHDYLDIGQMYTTSDGKTRLHITLHEGRLSPRLGIGINGSVDVDWGDGSVHDTMTGSLISTTVYKEHTYSSEGDYVIALTITGTVQFNGTSGYSYIFGKTSGNSSTNKTYLSILTRVEIGAGITSIGNNAFYNCYALTSVTIPSSVTSISGSAFYNCYSLTSVTIPSSVTSIGSGAFSACSSLTSVTLPSSVTSIGDNAFTNCYALTSVTIPSSVTSIGSGAFSACSSLTSVTIPSSVTSIGSNVFTSCYSLTSVTIPSGVTSIGNNVLYNCSSLTSVTLPSSVTSIGDSAFYNCYALTSVTIPSSVTSIGSSAFSNCYALTSVTILSSVTSISNNAFTNCYALISVTISSSVTSIGNSAFANCYALTSVTIPSSVTSISGSAFSNCSSLTCVTIPSSVTSIGSSAFYNCSGLGFIKFERESPPTVTSSNVFSNVPTDCIIYIPTGTLSAYTSASNYPSSSRYSYVEY